MKFMDTVDGPGSKLKEVVLMQQLLEIMAKLRDPDGGCPWDKEQTFATIAPHTIEEAYEVADAIARGDMGELKEELGDLLFQVVFYSQMAREAGFFEFQDVVDAISEKMLRRHPHVFGDDEIADAEEQTAAWEQLKAAERKAKAEDEAAHSQLDGVALALPALIRGEKLQKRAAKVGFDWPDASGVIDKVREELGELQQEIGSGGDSQRIEEEVGDLLFSCVNLARHLKIDAETALRHANEKFERRFRLMEAKLAEKGQALHDANLDVMDAAWKSVKAEE